MRRETNVSIGNGFDRLIRARDFHQKSQRHSILTCYAAELCVRDHAQDQ